MCLTFFNDTPIPKTPPPLPLACPPLGPVFVEIPNNMRTRESTVFAHFVVGGGGGGEGV